MIPDFPKNKISTIDFFLLRPDVAKSLPCWLSQFRKAKLRQPTGQRLSNVRRHQTKISIGPILFSYYEESRVSSNLNSNLIRIHCAHPKCFYCLLGPLEYFLKIELIDIVGIHVFCKVPRT